MSLNIVLLYRSILQICNTIILRISIQVPNNCVWWLFPKKNLSHQLMQEPLGALSGVSSLHLDHEMSSAVF